jgi:hypothetical protein
MSDNKTEYYEDFDSEEEGKGPFKLLPLLIVLLAVGGFAAIAWYAYDSTSSNNDLVDVPLIKAEAEPYKSKPSDPGGMEIAYEDKKIYDVLEGKNAADSTADKKVANPKLEEPMAREKLVQQMDQSAKSVTAKNLPAPSANNAPGSAEKIVGSTITAKPVAPATATRATAPVAPVVASKPVTAPTPAPVVDAKPVMKPATTNSASSEDDDLAKALNSVAVMNQQRNNTVANAAAKPSLAQVTSGVSSSGSYRAQLAAFKSQHEAEQSWQNLASKHRDVLGGVGHNIEKADLGDKGIFYRLRVGPFTNKEDAGSFCRSMSSRSQGCFVVSN